MPNRGPHSSVGRRPSRRSPKERVLVVCEGAYTEPLYFGAMRDRLRLNTLEVKATKGVDPRTLVNIASEEDEREKRNGERFDSVYCVFDRDSHPQFDEASNMARARGFRLARSWPCFEFWLLLHFDFVRAPYARKGSLSPCDVCIRDLRKHLPRYKKATERHLTIFGICWRTPSQTDTRRQRMPQPPASATHQRRFTNSLCICKSSPPAKSEPRWLLGSSTHLRRRPPALAAKRLAY